LKVMYTAPRGVWAAVAYIN